MKKTLLFISFLLLFITAACGDSDVDEFLAYQNEYVPSFMDQLDEADEMVDRIWDAETNEEMKLIIDDELDPLLSKLKDDMIEKKPKNSDMEKYHKLILDSFKAYTESLELDVEAFNGFLNNSMATEETEQFFSDSLDKFNEGYELAEESEKELDHLAEKYDLVEVDE